MDIILLETLFNPQTPEEIRMFNKMIVNTYYPPVMNQTFTFYDPDTAESINVAGKALRTDIKSNI